MGNQNPEKRTGMKKEKEKHHVYAAVVLILAAAAIISIWKCPVVLYCEVEVNGNEYCDSSVDCGVRTE